MPWTLTATGADGWGSHGSFSTVGITGDGYAEYTLGSGRDFVIGLSASDGSASFNTIEHGLGVQGDGTVTVYESGAVPFASGTAVDGDVLRVRRTGTTVTYQVNGSTVYTSGVAAAGTQYIDTAVYGLGFIIGGISLNTASGEITIAWTGLVGCTMTEGSVSDNSFETWGDSLTFGFGATTSYPRGLAALATRGVNNGGVSGQTSTQIKTRMLARTTRYSHPAIIWAGRNNYTSPTTVKADIASMVSALGHPNYLVLGIINGDYANEYSGQSDYTTLVTLNNDLASTYSSRFIDIRAHLVSLYNPGNGTDVTDHSHDVPPTSLRSDVLHLNDAGYAAVAAKVYASVSILTTPAGSGHAARWHTPETPTLTGHRSKT